MNSYVYSSTKQSTSTSKPGSRQAGRRPKYQAVYDALLRAIRRGDYPPGGKLPAEPKLMAQFKVSRITVIRALRDLQVAGVLVRRHGSGSYVQESRTPNLLRVGLLFPRLLEPDSIFTVVHQTITRESQKCGWQVTFHEMSDQYTSEQADATLEQLGASGTRGVLYLPLPITARSAEVNETIARQCVNHHIPLVLLDRDISHLHVRSRFDLVGSDNESGGFLVAQHLLQRGCRRIVFFAGTYDHPTVEARLEGARHAVGLSPSAKLIVCSDDPDEPGVIGNILSRHQPDGAACANDMGAAKVLRNLLKFGVRVPEQIKLSGFDDTPTARLLPVPLTTVRQASEEMAVQAMNVMRQRLDRPDMPTVTVAIACTLIKRESTAGHEVATIRC